MHLYTFSELTRVKTFANVSYADGFHPENRLIIVSCGFVGTCKNGVFVNVSDS
jgi:uncharacterized protein (DUF2344 family)